MARSGDPFEQARRERDPIRQAKLAGELITLYQQRSVELARLRREAINRAADERGISFSAVAAELGLTRGRISQIRRDAPPVERAFFGVGPVTVALPLRQLPGRSLPVISSEDTRAYDMLTRLLGDLSFQFERLAIPSDGNWQPPAGDVIAICGPKSSPVTARAIANDPNLSFEPDEEGRWAIRDRHTAQTYESPMDHGDGRQWHDVAYFGRLPIAGEQTMLIIAGVHALGSVGVVQYLTTHLSDLYQQVGTAPFSMVIESQHDGDTVTRSEALCPPRIHQ